MSEDFPGYNEEYAEKAIQRIKKATFELNNPDNIRINIYDTMHDVSIVETIVGDEVPEVKAWYEELLKYIRRFFLNYGEMGLSNQPRRIRKITAILEMVSRGMDDGFWRYEHDTRFKKVKNDRDKRGN